MHEHLGSGRYHRVLIEIEGAVHVGFDKEVWIPIGGTEKVEGGGYLLDKFIPDV